MRQTFTLTEETCSVIIQDIFRLSNDKINMGQKVESLTLRFFINSALKFQHSQNKIV